MTAERSKGADGVDVSTALLALTHVSSISTPSNVEWENEDVSNIVAIPPLAADPWSSDWPQATRMPIVLLFLRVGSAAFDGVYSNENNAGMPSIIAR